MDIVPHLFFGAFVVPQISKIMLMECKLDI